MGAGTAGAVGRVRSVGVRATVAGIALALGLLLAIPGGASADAEWKLQAQIEGESYRPDLPILGVSCPSAKLCVAVAELNKVISSTDPTGGPSAWKVVQPQGEAETDCHQNWRPPCSPTNSRDPEAGLLPFGGPLRGRQRAGVPLLLDGPDRVG